MATAGPGEILDSKRLLLIGLERARGVSGLDGIRGITAEESCSGEIALRGGGLLMSILSSGDIIKSDDQTVRGRVIGVCGSECLRYNVVAVAVLHLRGLE